MMCTRSSHRVPGSLPRKRSRRGLGAIELVGTYPNRMCRIMSNNPGRQTAGATPVAMDDVKRCAAECSRDGKKTHFFDPGAMRFFKTRLPSKAYINGMGDAFFVTSEQARGHARRYSVRMYNASCQVKTIGEFQQYGTSAEATMAALRAATHHISRGKSISARSLRRRARIR